MRCHEVIRELAVPTDDRDSASLAEHLASCASCAGWAKRNAQLDRLWEAARPTEPSPETWATIWAHVASSVDSSTPTGFETFSLAIASSNGSLAKVETPLVPSRSSSRSGPWSWAAIGLIGLAQAAAIFLVVALTWHSSTTSRLSQVADNGDATASSSSVATTAPLNLALSTTGFEIEEGGVSVIHIEGSAARMSELTPQSASNRLEKRLRNLESIVVDEWYVMFNDAESLNKPIVAME